MSPVLTSRCDKAMNGEYTQTSVSSKAGDFSTKCEDTEYIKHDGMNPGMNPDDPKSPDSFTSGKPFTSHSSVRERSLSTYFGPNESMTKELFNHIAS